MIKPYQRFKSYLHEVHTEKVNKITLSSNDKRDYKHLIGLQHFHTEKMYLNYVQMKF